MSSIGLFIRKFFLAMGFVVMGVCAHAQSLRFDKFIIEDGLTSINAILIDEYGYQWFGGTHGLYKYDGYEFEAFTHDPSNVKSLSYNDVMVLFEDSRHNVWIGTSNHGVNVFDRQSESIVRPDGLQELSQSSVTSFGEDSLGNLWIGTLKNGIFVLSPTGYLKKHFQYNILNKSSLSDGDVFDIMKDAKDNMWVVTNSGQLDLFNPRDSSFIHYQFSENRLSGVRSGQKLLELDSTKLWIGTEGQGIFEFHKEQHNFRNYHADSAHSINNNIITGLAKDSQNNIWISTDGGGLNHFDQTANRFTHFLYNEGDEFSLSNNASYSLLVDQSDRIWLGMGDGKVNISSNSPFQFIRSGSGLSFNVVVDLHVDRRDNLWVATGGKGVDLIDLDQTELITNVNTESNKKIKSDIVLSIQEDVNANIWVGTLMGGVSQIDLSGKTLNNLMHGDPANSLSNDHVFDIACDREGNVWFATQGGGIDVYNPTSDIFRNYNTKNNSGLVSDRIQSIFIDDQGRVWVGHFSGGMQLYDVKTETFVSLNLPNGLASEISRYPIHSIAQDQANNILVSSGGLGLIVIKENFQTFTSYNLASGMPSNSVYGVMEFDNYYWLSTNAGIVRIDPSNQNIRTINKSDGLLTNDFESGAISVSSQGKLYFGSKEGIVYFDPDAIDIDQDSAEIVFTNLSVFNEYVKPGDMLDGTKVLEQSLLYSDTINLPYTQNNFSLTFACPKYHSPNKLLFKYQLQGLDNRWINTRRNRRFVNYSNIDFGQYELLVQVSTDGGSTWLGDKSIHIIIHPPWYFTTYAYLLYFVLLVIAISVVYQFVRSRVELRNQLKFEIFSREKDNELNKEKINFFTGVSHEVRTPLTLILGHLEKLSNLNNLDNRLYHELGIIRKNGNRLLILINQLLDFRKIESGQMNLKVSRQDVVYLMRELLLPFREIAIQKDIKLQFRNDLSDQSAYLDVSKFEIILFNLLSNALKFTPSNGEIDITMDKSNKDLIVCVSNSGEPIAPENVENIFKPFFQGNAGNKSGMLGTGIGLSLVKEMTELHKGKVTVACKNHRTEFTVSLPWGKENYEETEWAEPINKIQEFVKIDHPAKPAKENAEIKLLIVEDNLEILEFLTDSFGDQYEVIQAMSGKEGLSKAYETIPDLIISDVMMPEMDGIEMCRHLKKDIRTNHIPIVLLTARTGFIHEHSGLETGADDYITKPFQFGLLDIRVRNLVENRKLVHQKFRQDRLLEPKAIDVNDPNEQFIAELMNLIEENISDSEYSVKDLAKSMGFSHSVLYRKIHALTNLSINDFIKSVRLKRAAHLLNSGAYSISDVGYKVGFSNPKYFSTCFRIEYGKTPSEYMRNGVS